LRHGRTSPFELIIQQEQLKGHQFLVSIAKYILKKQNKNKDPSISVL
jgi:hypothetical protein